MAQIEVQRYDTFETWRQKTNLISDSVGDLAALDTADKSNVVEAINEVKSRLGGEIIVTSNRALLMSIVFGG